MSVAEVATMAAVVVNTLQWAPALKALKTWITSRRQLGQPALGLRVVFGALLAEPVVLIYLLFTAPVTAVLALATAAIVAGTALVARGASKLATSPVPMIDPEVAASNRRINRLRPKHRALLLDAGGGQ